MVMQKLIPGEIFTYPNFGFYYITINENEIVNNNNFGNFKLGNISGYVKNKNNEPLVNIKVILSNNFSFLTNKEGYYEFKDLDAGTYNILVEEQVVNDIIINSGSAYEYNFVLDKENIIVEEKKSLLDKFYEDFFSY